MNAFFNSIKKGETDGQKASKRERSRDCQPGGRKAAHFIDDYLEGWTFLPLI
jgi:hypothetical protein